jgi:hypothetical protein
MGVHVTTKLTNTENDDDDDDDAFHEDWIWLGHEEVNFSS